MPTSSKPDFRDRLATIEAPRRSRAEWPRSAAGVRNPLLSSGRRSSPDGRRHRGSDRLARRRQRLRRRPISAKTIRLRDKEHCKFVATQPCVVCGRTPTEAHHIRFAQPRALGRKVSDEYTVPVCRLHHRELHRYGDEASWWAAVSIDPLPIALELWKRSQLGADSRRLRRT